MKKILISIGLILCISAQSVCAEDNWFFGGGVNVASFQEYRTSDIDGADESTNIYGLNLVIGYHINDWLDIEASHNFYESENSTHCDDPEFSDVCVNWKRDFAKSYAGLRFKKYLGRVFGFTGKLAIARTGYKDNWRNETLTSVNPGVGVIFNIVDRFNVMYELDRADFYDKNFSKERKNTHTVRFTFNF